MLDAPVRSDKPLSPVPPGGSPTPPCQHRQQNGNTAAALNRKAGFKRELRLCGVYSWILAVGYLVVCLTKVSSVVFFFFLFQPVHGACERRKPSWIYGDGAETGEASRGNMRQKEFGLLTHRYFGTCYFFFWLFPVCAHRNCEYGEPRGRWEARRFVGFKKWEFLPCWPLNSPGGDRDTVTGGCRITNVLPAPWGDVYYMKYHFYYHYYYYYTSLMQP